MQDRLYLPQKDPKKTREANSNESAKVKAVGCHQYPYQLRVVAEQVLVVVAVAVAVTVGVADQVPGLSGGFLK